MADVLAVAFEGHPIRVTDETPKRAAVFDVLAAMGYANPRDKWTEVKERHPEVVGDVGRIDNFHFGGRGQRPTPVMGEVELLKLLMVLDGPKAAAFREWASSILFRYLKGDRDLANEIHLRAELLEDGDEPFEPQPAEVPPVEVSPLKAQTPKEVATQLEAFGAALFAKEQWEQSKDFYDLALRYRALEAEANDSASGQRSSPTAPLAQAPDSEPANTPALAPSQERRLTSPRELAQERRDVAPRGSTHGRPIEPTRDPLEPALSPRQALFEGWSELTKGAALSVWEALGKYRTTPARYPRFTQALTSLFGLRNFEESLRWGDELQRELARHAGSVCQKLWLVRNSSRNGGYNTPRFHMIKL